jgi:glycosyltransferase involved in cell wall biosynthesis
VNIWLINHYALPPTENGGTRHYSHARQLVRRGHHVEVVACSFLHLNHVHLPLASANPWERRFYGEVPFNWIYAQGYQGNSLPRILNMFQFAQRVWRKRWAAGLEKPDLVLGSSPDPFAALAAERIAASYNVPFVLEIRDLWPYVLTEVGGYSAHHPFVVLVDQVMRHLYRRASRIIVFSRCSPKLLASYGADPKKVVWIPNGVDLDLYPAPQPAPIDGQFTVSYLGAHNQWNSLDAVLDAAKLLLQSGNKDVLFQFVGGGVERSRLIQRAKDEGIENVRFEKSVPKKDVPELLHKSDALILNSRMDNISKNWMSYNKIYDYLAAGRPIIFGRCGAEDPVSEARAGISVKADNAEQLAHAVAHLALQTRETLWEYGVRGRRYVEAHYGIATLVDRFEKLALEVTGRSDAEAANGQETSVLSFVLD